MRYVLFATAGHIDHGKTSLIKALTGIDADRLPEEKKRGLSIDMGFAYMDFDDIGIRLEFIDVPGHERFIKNAVAGISSATGLLLVIDASEGIMPQTVEHFRVAKSFGVKEGIAVLTKIDKVDRETLEVAKEEVGDFLRNESVNFHVSCVSPRTGEGLDNLKETLKNVAEKLKEGKALKPLRVLVDSAFSVRGYGTVIRGSCIEGRVKEGDRVAIEPVGLEVRLRKIQNHGVFVEEAEAGERIALNVPDVDKEKVKRGFWVLKPNSYLKSRLLIVKSDVDVYSGKLYSLFFGMREVHGRFKGIGEDVYLLRLSEEVVSKRGDRAVLLDSSARLMGSIEVLHPAVSKPKKEFIKDNLRCLKENFGLYILRELDTKGVDAEYFFKLTGYTVNFEHLQEAVKVGDRFYSARVLEKLRNKLATFLEENLKKDTLGIHKAEVMEKLKLSQRLLEYLLNNTGDYRLVEEYIVVESNAALEEHPEVKNLLSLLSEGFREEKDLLSEGVSGEVLRLAVKRKLVHRIGSSFFLSDVRLQELVKSLKELGEEFSIREAKEKLKLSRKYIVPLLEYLDYLGLTVRRGEKRRWRSNKISF